MFVNTNFMFVKTNFERHLRRRNLGIISYDTHLRLQIYHRVFASDTAQEQSFRSARTTRHYNYEPRRMCQISLWRLRMIMPTVTYSTAGSANGNATAIPLVAGAVSKFCHFIDDLVESRKYLQQ